MVTAPNLKTARKLAKEILQARVAACANIIPKIESHYWWQGKINSSNEVLIIFKTMKKSLNELEQKVLEIHPYDTPEIVAIKIESGSTRYLDWIQQSVKE